MKSALAAYDRARAAVVPKREAESAAETKLAEATRAMPSELTVHE